MMGLVQLLKKVNLQGVFREIQKRSPDLFDGKMRTTGASSNFAHTGYRFLSLT